MTLWRSRLGTAVVAWSAVLIGCGHDESTTPNPSPESPSAPTALWALPGPADGQVTLAWSGPSDGVYTLYRSTHPGVTPATGTKIGPLPVISYVDTGLAPGTYYYIVTQTSDGVESAPSPEATIVYDTGIALNMQHPIPLGTGGDDLQVRVAIASTYEVASATAAVAGRSGPLTVAPTGGTPPPWQGSIDLRGLTHGPQRLVLQVSDVQGHSVEASVPFVYDTPPTLTVTAPLEYAVARPSLHVTATCTDDDPAGCTGIEVVLVDETFSVVQGLLGVTGGVIDADVTPKPGGILRIRGLDTRGQSDTVYRSVVVDQPAAAVKPLLSVSGRILDASADRVVYLDSNETTQALRLRDRSTGGELTVDEGGQYAVAFLAPDVVLFSRRSSASPYHTLHLWRRGTVTDLGGYEYVEVSGGYAIYWAGGALIRRNLATGASLTVALDAGNTDQGVAPDGDVAYWTGNLEIKWYQDQTGSVVISPPGTDNSFPRTDGGQVVYRRRLDQNVWEIVRYAIGGESVLGSARSVEPRSVGRFGSPADYETVNGWAAFTRLGSGNQLQVWTRAPAGQERQVTTYAESSLVLALGPQGEVAFQRQSQTGAGMQLATPPYTTAPVAVGSPAPVRFLSQGPVKFLGNTLFSLTP